MGGSQDLSLEKAPSRNETADPFLKSEYFAFDARLLAALESFNFFGLLQEHPSQVLVLAVKRFHRFT